MKKFLIILCIFFPVSVFAHAVPTSYTPAHGANIMESPPEVIVSFTDRIDPGNAVLILHRATGTPHQLAAYVDEHDPRTLHAALPVLKGGATIMWGVTSLDDEHYTRGAFNFSVAGDGDAQIVPAKWLIDEARFAVFLFAASGLLIVLRIASWAFLEKRQRCRTCRYSYTLLELLVGAAVLLASLMLLFTPLLPEWEKEAKESGISIGLHTQQGSPLMHLSVASLEDLPVPLFEISNGEATINPMPVTLTPFSKSNEVTTYSFPTSVFIPYGNWHVSTTFVRGNHYDAHGAMMFAYPDDVLSAMHMSPMHSRGAWGALALSFFALILAAWRVWGLVMGKSRDRIPNK